MTLEENTNVKITQDGSSITERANNGYSSQQTTLNQSYMYLVEVGAYFEDEAPGNSNTCMTVLWKLSKESENPSWNLAL